MADFSAVIRRAIDGLSANRPEERGRIYARARATIQRQLDSLPEGMNRTIFEAQLVKIEDSILEIEQEYANAGPELQTQDGGFEQNQTNENVQRAPERPISQPVVENVPVPDVPVVNEVATPPEVISEAPLENLPSAAPEIVAATEPEPVVEEPIVEEPVVDVPEVSSPVLKDVEPEDSLESVEVSAPTRSERFNSAEDAIDSELQIPNAPQTEIIEPLVADPIIEQRDEPVAPVPVDEPVETPINDTVATDSDSNLIDQAVSEIRSTLQEDVPDKATSTDPNLFFGFGEEALPEAPVPKQQKSPIVIIIAVLLLIFVALTVFFWRVGWQGVQDLLPESASESTEVSESQGIDILEDRPVQADQNEEKTTPADDVATVSGEVEKFTQRLNSDGSEIDAGRASDLIDGLPNEEGRSVASADASDTANQSEPIAAQANDGTPTLQKMFFYETSLGLEQQARYEGSIVWSEKTESDSAISRPYIEGTIQVPERDLSIVMTIKLNGDETLPVSHLIDLNFVLPEEFDGGEIEQITEVKFKSSEEQTGDRLEAISAKIDKSFFVVGLQNDKLDVVESNLQLMSQRGWIDIPISYTNGRKALITLEKGASGKAIFDKVLASWKQNPVQ